MNTTDPTHLAFSDESNYLTGRYRSLGLVTMVALVAEGLCQELKEILDQSDVRELKWQKLTSARHRFAAIKAIDALLPHLLSGAGRVDVLVWDVEDSRHSVKRRDDITNLQILYYQLFKNVFRMRWSTDAVWRLVPDENNQLDWDRLEEFLRGASSEGHLDRDLLSGGRMVFRIQKHFGIKSIEPCHSHEVPLAQLADLFAGLASYSRSSYGTFDAWLRERCDQMVLFGEEESASPSFSCADIERCAVVQHVHDACREAKMGLSLKSSGGFRTRDPNRPLNFWWYIPQHPDDKAPVKDATW